MTQFRLTLLALLLCAAPALSAQQTQPPPRPDTTAHQVVRTRDGSTLVGRIVAEDSASVRIETTGGGGWGHPFDREVERVQADVRGGFVSAAQAREDYGVALSADGRTLDVAETARRRRRRFPTKLFHRGEYRDTMI